MGDWPGKKIADCPGCGWPIYERPILHMCRSVTYWEIHPDSARNSYDEGSHRASSTGEDMGDDSTVLRDDVP